MRRIGFRPLVSAIANSKTIAFAQPDTSAGVYPLLLKGAKDEAAKRAATSCCRATRTASSTPRSTSSTPGSARASAAIIVLPLDNNAMAPADQEGARGEREVPRLLRQGAARHADGWVIFNNLAGRRARRHRRRQVGQQDPRRQGQGRAADARDPADRPRPHPRRGHRDARRSRRAPRSWPSTRACWRPSACP